MSAVESRTPHDLRAFNNGMIALYDDLAPRGVAHRRAGFRWVAFLDPSCNDRRPPLRRLPRRQAPPTCVVNLPRCGCAAHRCTCGRGAHLRQMKALTYQGPYRVAIRNKPTPRIEHPQDGIVRVTAAAICGSDLHLLHGLVPDTRIGFTFGHEFVGVVEELGPNAQGVRKGDRVMLPFQIFCGGCYYCTRGLTSCCENTNPATDAGTGIYGYSHTMGGYDGGQAEYVRVPFISVDAEKIPDGVADLDALPLTDAATTGYQAAEMTEIKGGETVLVLGCGPVGLFAMWSLWAMGAGRIIAVDHVDYRLEFARRWLGVETLNFKDVDLVTTVKGMTDDRGADATVEAVGCEAAGSPVHRTMGVYLKMEAGSPQAINFAIHSTKKGGVISLIGAYGPPYIGVDLGTFMNKAQRMNTGQASVKRYMPRMLEHVQAGRLKPSEVFTHRLPLDDAPAAYRTFARKQDGCIKVALLPNHTLH